MQMNGISLASGTANMQLDLEQIEQLYLGIGKQLGKIVWC